MTAPMPAEVWHYQCHECGHETDRPGLDLTWNYAQILGMSAAGHVVLLDLLSNPAYQQISNLVAADPRAPHDPIERATFTRAIASELLDTDPYGNAYEFTSPYTCPECHARALHLDHATRRSHTEQIHVLTSSVFGTLNHDEQGELVRDAITRTLTSD